MVEIKWGAMNRVTNIAWRTASGSRLGGFAYRYDALGRIVSRAHDLGGASFDRDYAYDDMDRLASDGGTAYAYDAAGNRMTRTEDGETVTYSLGAGDRLATWTGGSYRYDAAGCVTRITRGADTWDLTWNGQYQLVSVSTNGAFAESYSYDALGRRVTTRNAEGTERHVYDDSWQVVADLDEGGNVLRSYVWGEGIDRLLAVKIGGRTYTALTDVQGTVWGYADEGGSVVARWTYDAWGNALTEEVDASAAELRAVRYRFQGREHSAVTGLTNFRMRWYDAVTGRWLSKDPIRLHGGINLYACYGNSPLVGRDSFGLEPSDVDVSSVGYGVENALESVLPEDALSAKGKSVVPATLGVAETAVQTMEALPNLGTVLRQAADIQDEVDLFVSDPRQTVDSENQIVGEVQKDFYKASRASENVAKKDVTPWWKGWFKGKK